MIQTIVTYNGLDGEQHIAVHSEWYQLSTAIWEYLQVAWDAKRADMLLGSSVLFRDGYTGQVLATGLFAAEVGEDWPRVILVVGSRLQVFSRPEDYETINVLLDASVENIERMVHEEYA